MHIYLASFVFAILFSSKYENICNSYIFFKYILFSGISMSVSSLYLPRYSDHPPSYEDVMKETTPIHDHHHNQT